MKIIFISILFLWLLNDKKKPDLSIGLSNNFILFKWYFFPLFLNWKISIFKFQFYFSYHLIHFFICCCLSLHRNMMINSKSTVGIIFFPHFDDDDDDVMMIEMCLRLENIRFKEKERERKKKLSFVVSSMTLPRHHTLFFLNKRKIFILFLLLHNSFCTHKKNHRYFFLRSSRTVQS